MFITRDNSHTHLHFPHFQFYLLLFLMVIVIGILTFTLYKYYLANYYDSSLNGSEIKEVLQQTIPQDVQQALQQVKQKLKPNAASPSAIQLPAVVHVPILMYHYVEYVKDKNDKTRASLNTTPDTLEREIKTLSEAGFTFMTNAELTDVLDGKAKLPPKPILLTFDDGYRDFYIDAYPILKKYHAKATQYVIAGFLDRSNHLLTSQLKEIANEGLVEIGAHTVHHVWLKGRSLKDVSSEVFQSREILEKLIKKEVISFAYPFGAFDEQAIQVVKDAGFKSATSTIPGIDQKQEYRYFLFRLRPGGEVGQSLLNWLKQTKF